MTITRIQSSTYNPNTGTITLASTPSNGNMLVLTAGSGGSLPIITGISQTGVVWQGSASVNASNVNGVVSEIWYGTVGAGASKTITLNYSSIYFSDFNVCEYSGLPTPVLDRTANATGTSVNGVTGTTSTLTGTPELCVATIAVYSGTGFNTLQYSPINGFALLDGISTGGGGSRKFSSSYLELITSSTAAQSSGASLSNSNYYAGCIATFYSGSAAPVRLGLAVKNVAVSYPLIFSMRMPKFMVRRF